MRDIPEVIKIASIKSLTLATSAGGAVGIAPFLYDLYKEREINPDIKASDLFLEGEKDYPKIFRDWAAIGFLADGARTNVAKILKGK